MAGRDRPRLGRGLSGLLARPVEVDVSTKIVETSKWRTGGEGENPEHRPKRGDAQASVGEGARLVMIDVGAIVPSRFQPRSAADEAGLRSLAESIRAAGVMQPVVVRRAEGGGRKAEGGGAEADGELWELVAGERRWRAAMLAGLRAVPAVVAEIDDRSAAEWALIENIQREELNPMDRARAFRRLIDEFGLLQQEVAERVGIERSSVANFLRLMELEEEIQRLVAEGALSMGHAKALLSVPPGMKRVESAEEMAKHGWSVREAEAWASERSMEAKGMITPTTKVGEGRGGPGWSGPTRAELERQLGEFLGTKVRVRTDKSGKKGRVVLEFYSLEHFEGLMERMGFRMES